jgi:hypothetical protein
MIRKLYWCKKCKCFHREKMAREHWQHIETKEAKL